jgi:class 3 adenylate cyclase/CHAT domain-containing protein
MEDKRSDKDSKENLSSEHGEREGEARRALLEEGATPLRGQARAPKIERLLSEREEIERTLKSEFTRQVTIMFTDIKGSTSFYESRGDLDGRAMVHRHNEIVIPLIKGGGGTLLKTIGDATMSIFDDPATGVATAMEIQKRLHEHNLKKSDHDQIHVRIGLNFGAGIVEESDVYGDVVNVASRIESLAEADEILVTEDLYRKVKDTDEFTFRYVNSFPVKGKREPLKAYRLVWHEEDLIMGKTRKPLETLQKKEGVFVLDASVSGGTMKISGYERTDGEERAVRGYAEVKFNSDRIRTYTAGITDLLNRANKRGKISNDLLIKLKEYGRLLYDELIPPQIKERLAKTDEQHLMISIDDNLVQVPWELLFDGKDFFCRRFSMGRTVSTKQPVSIAARAISRPLKMQILADPRGDLSASYDEGIGIKNEIGKLEDWFDVSLKTTDIRTDYVKAKIRYFDIVHYAGHAEHDSNDPGQSGWILKDGKITGGEIMQMIGAMPMPSLIFSNACQTGQTDEWKLADDYEDKIFGLANAFLVSGLQHYIGTFWEIPDEAGFHFALQFYKILAEGVTIGEAVRRARYRLVEKYGEDTIVWASYMLYGDPTTRYVSAEMPPRKEVEEKESEKDILIASGLRNKEEVIQFPKVTSRRTGNTRNYVLAGAAVLIVAAILFTLTYTGFGRQGGAPPATVVTERSTQAPDLESKKRIDELVTSLAARYREGKFQEPVTRQDDWTSRPLTMVFMDIKSGDEKGNDKEKLISLLSGSLQSEPRIRMVERELLGKLLEELKLSTSSLADPATSLKIGKLLSARVIVTGSIIPDDKGQTIILRFIDTETTAVKKVISLAAPSKQIDPGVIQGLSGKIIEWSKADFPLRGRIVSVSGDQCEINIGQAQGVKKGDRMEVLHEQDKGGSYTPLGEIQVKEAEQGKSWASVAGSKEAAKVGAKVREK